MDQNIFKRNELLAQKVIKGLESRNMSGYYAASQNEALQQALSLIPEGSSVTMGGGMSVHEIGLPDVLKSGNYNFIDRDAMEDKRAAMLAAYDADVFLSSANAVTEDGILVNREEGRLVGRRIELSESDLEQLNHRLARITSAIRGGTRPIAEITYFIPDPLKAGGRYETVTERIRKVDAVGQAVILERKTGPSGSWMRIPIADILELRGENL